MLKKVSLIALQKAINYALALDETTPLKLEALQGKVVEIIVSPLNTHFFIVFDNHTLELHPAHHRHPDTIIHSSPLGLIRLSILPASKVRSLFNDSIRISGDIDLGQQLKALIDNLDIDWEEHLAQFTGDMVAHQLGSIVRQGRRLKNQVKTSLRQNLGDYAKEELRITPPAEELHDFFDDVDALSLRVERLAAHVNQLLARHESD